jgi:hypothetical protein
VRKSCCFEPKKWTTRAGSTAASLAIARMVVDVVPADADDPRGLAFSSLLLPLTLVSTLTGLIVTVVTRPGLVQAGGLVGVALLVGVVAISIVQGWLGVIGGDWWANVGVVALLVLAIASLVAGLTAVLGIAGFVLAALLMIFVGNPFSGVSTAPALLPEWAGLLGQLLPPAAGGGLLRSSAFFDGSGGTGPFAMLLAWAHARARYRVGRSAASPPPRRTRRAPGGEPARPREPAAHDRVQPEPGRR